jgi:hypothetical protein
MLNLEWFSRDNEWGEITVNELGEITMYLLCQLDFRSIFFALVVN